MAFALSTSIGTHLALAQSLTSEYNWSAGPDVGDGGASSNGNVIGRSFDSVQTFGDFQATLHLHDTITGLGAPFDGDFGTPGSPWASLEVAGSDAGVAVLNEEIVATIPLGDGANSVFVSTQHLIDITGYVAPGYAVFFSVEYISGVLLDTLVTDEVTAPGNFEYSVHRSAGNFLAGNIQIDGTFGFRIERAGGGVDPSYVQLTDPASDGITVEGITVVPEPTSLALLAIGAIGLGLGALTAAARRRMRTRAV
jgi:hypothetical protein